MEQNNELDFEDLLILLENLNSVKTYKKIVKFKKDLLQVIKEGNRTGDIEYFGSSLGFDYTIVSKQLAALIDIKLTSIHQNVESIVQKGIERLKDQALEMCYSLKYTNRSISNDVFKRYNLYQSKKTLIHNIEELLLPENLRISKTKSVSMKGSFRLKVNKIKAKKYYIRHLYRGPVALDNYSNLAVQYFVFDPRIFILLINLESTLIQLIKSQYYELNSADNYFIRYVQRYQKFKASYNMDLFSENFYLGDWDEVNRSFGFDRIYLKGRSFSLQLAEQALSHLKRAAELVIQRHQLLFKYTLAKHQHLYINELKSVIFKGSRGRGTVSDKALTHYKEELNSLNTPVKSETLKNMMDVIENFNRVYVKLNKEIRTELSNCKLNIELNVGKAHQ